MTAFENLSMRIEKRFAADFEKKITSFARKCAKFGIDFEWKKMEESTDYIFIGDRRLDGTPDVRIIRATETETLQQIRNSIYNNQLYPLPVVVYEMTDTTAKVNGEYAIAAKLDRLNGGNLVETFVNPETHERFEIPEKYRHSDGFCEHCRTKRERSKLYIIQNRKSGEFFQVGASCMKFYNWGISAENIGRYYEWLTEICKCGLHDDPSDTEIREYCAMLSRQNYYNVRDVIKFAIMVIAEKGYCRADGDTPTKEIVDEACNCYYNEKHETVREMLRRKYNGKFDRVVDESEVDKVITHFTEKRDTSDFTANVQLLLNCGNVDRKHVGFIACLPQVMTRDLERAEAAKAKEKFEHFGEVKKRYTLPVDDCRVVATYPGYGYYDVITIFRIKCGNNILIWKTQKDIESEDFIGKSITFTVKEHSEFNGEKQTEITRVKIC